MHISAERMREFFREHIFKGLDCGGGGGGGERVYRGGEE